MNSQKFIFVSILSFLALVGVAQNPGDTIVVESLHYGSGTRDTIVHFPNPGLSYQKVIMEYSMRCKNAQVSTGADRNKGCGEWDYSCNTYLHDSSHVDSVLTSHPRYTISGYTGTSFNYVNSPTYNFYQNIQQSVSINSIINDSTSTVGMGSLNLDHVLHTDTHAGKSQYLFTAAELMAAGLDSGNIDAITLDVSNNPGNAKFFRVRLKETTKTALTDTTIDLSGFTEVYYHNTSFSNGLNRIQFYSPFAWDGSSNLIVEMTFTNKVNGSAINFSGNNSGSGLLSFGEIDFEFNGSNYIQANGYKGVGGSGNRTIEAWIRTTQGGEEIVSWGTNSAGQKYLLRLDGSGKVRTEVNSGWAVGTSSVSDGEWHHVVSVLNGTNTNDIEIYVDGQKEVISSVGARAINTGSSLSLRVTRGFHNLYWEGNISEVRVWSSALSASEIRNWMYKTIDNSHSSYSDLELYYPLNESVGTSIYDASGNGRNAQVVNGALWKKAYGVDHFRDVQTTNERPNISFHRGSYNLTVSNDTIIDSVMQNSNLVTEYQVFSKAGTLRSDSIGAISSSLYWHATTQNLYDPNGVLLNSSTVTADGTLTVTQLPYFSRNPSRFEIMSFVTPYGIGLDFGQDGKTWLFDMTDYIPILHGQKRMTIERGGQWQEEMDIKFLFIVGTPDRDVEDIQQIWKVDYKSYASISNNTFFEPRDVLMNSNASAFKIRSAITGHGQEGEFIPRTHYLNLDGGSKEFSWQVWNEECPYNPVYPQGGTWIYPRAGWCPGMATDILENDITVFVTPGQTTEIDYGIDFASGTSNYIVNHQLVSYGAPNFTLDASVTDIISPTNRVEYERITTLCEGPVVVIKNSGSTTLTSLTINYWVNNASSPETYLWTGNLFSMEETEVMLPAQSTLWQSLSGSNNTFYVEVAAPNGGSDEYTLNNKMYSSFEIPEIMPSYFYIQLRTNLKGGENNYKLYDQWNNLILSRGGMGNNTIYRDTVDLADGCYVFILEDSGDNGISFWANSDGSGSLLFRNITSSQVAKIFEGDFGGEIRYEFTVNSALTDRELDPVIDVRVYPNPANKSFTVQVPEGSKVNVSILNSLGQNLSLPSDRMGDKIIFNSSSLSDGVYYIQIIEGDKTIIKKLIKA